MASCGTREKTKAAADACVRAGADRDNVRAGSRSAFRDGSSGILSDEPDQMEKKTTGTRACRADPSTGRSVRPRRIPSQSFAIKYLSNPGRRHGSVLMAAALIICIASLY